MNSVSPPADVSGLQPGAAPAASTIPVDRINELYRGEIFTDESARIARDRIHWMCAEVEGDTVLDVGCSQGITAILLAREGCTVTAIDTHPESMAYARDELARETPLVQGRIRLIETDLASLPEEPAFDTIVLGEVLEHQVLPERFLRSAVSRVKPGGRLVITTPFALHPHPDHKISVFPRHIKNIADRLGLTVVHLDVEGHYVRSVLVRPGTETVVPATVDLLEVTEQATLKSQQRLFDRLDDRAEQLKKKTDALKITQRKLAEANANVEQSQQQAAEAKKARDALAAREAKLAAETAALRSQHAAELKQTREAMAAEEARHGQQRAALQTALDEARAAHAAAQRDVAEAKQQFGAIRPSTGSSVERQAHDREVAAHLQRIATLEASAQSLRNSTSHRLGETLVAGVKSGNGLRALPGQLWGLGREVFQRRRARSAGNAFSSDEVQGLLHTFEQSGIEALRMQVESKRGGPSYSAVVFTRLSRELRTTSPNGSAETARLAYAADPQPFRAKWLAFRLFDVGALAEPVQLLRATAGTEFSASELRRADEIRSLHRLQQQLPGWTERARPAYAPRAGSMLYVSATCLPYHVSGYSTRSHELLQALTEAGLEVHALTRPGYPWDRQDRLAEASGPLTQRGAVQYRHLRQPAGGLPLESYLREAAEAIKKEALRLRVACIHAASNHVNALPALIAARELGLPFAFEMRGLWDLTRAARVDNYEGSERYQLNMSLEQHCALHADRVYVISSELHKQVLDWGVEEARIHLLPNCVNTSAIEAAVVLKSGPHSVTLTLGYAGSVLHYEGLGLLVEAIALLRSEGLAIKVKIIGDGEALPALREQVQAAGLSDTVELLGKLPPEEALRLVATCDAVALPRLPLAVCEMVPPIKLVEAMAMGKPVVVPNLAAFCEEIEDRRTGLMFKAGDAASLADALRRLAADPTRGASLGQAAREHVLEQRLWSHFASRIAADVVAGVRGAAPRQSLGAAELPSADPLAGLELSGLVESYQRGGAEALRTRSLEALSGLVGRARAAQLLQIGKALGQNGHSQAEGVLASTALELDNSEQTLRGFFWAAQRAHLFEEACNAIRQIESLYGSTPTTAQQEKLEQLKRSPAYQLTVLDLLPAQPLERLKSKPKRICYVLHNSLPYSTGGYSTRSHGVAGGIQQAGYEVIVLTRPGFPADIKPDLHPSAIPAEDCIDGIRYLRTPRPQRLGDSKALLSYVPQSANALEKHLRELRPELVVAASNHVVALPALIAARRLGIPFVYEVRGFWEITRVSRDSVFGDSAAFAVQRLLEAKVAQNADHVFTLTEPMREELIGRGVKGDRIDLLRNSCDPSRFLPRERDSVLAERLGIPISVPVIGYIGTFVEYEGLDDLAAACALLKQRGIEFRLLLVGNENTSGLDRGPITAKVAAVAAAAGFSDWLIMPGRVPHEDVESYYSLIDVAPFPRKPLPVCEMVSPMKPLEALAMEKAVIVSSVRALTEMIQDGKTGRVFEKGQINSLADALEALIQQPELRAALGRQGREWVQSERTWQRIGQLFTQKLAGKLSGTTASTTPTTRSMGSGKKVVEPRWWTQVDESLRASCRYVDVKQWSLSDAAQGLKESYVQRFGAEAVNRRIPTSNWARADICAQTVAPADRVLDVGSGLGEFVNLLSLGQRHGRITSVDLRDYDLWFDATGRLQRVYRDLFALDPAAHASEVVTCFEVIEHLPPQRVADAVRVLRSLAQRKLYVSVPFMEPLPLYRGHHTRFDAENLRALFPDARFTVFSKGNGEQPSAWILCEIEMIDSDATPIQSNSSEPTV